MPYLLRPVRFYSDTIYYIEKDAQILVPVRPLVENMGLDWNVEYSKLLRDKDCPLMVPVSVTGYDDIARGEPCVPYRKLSDLLNAIKPDTKMESIWAKLLYYRKECANAICRAWVYGESTPPSSPVAAPVAEQAPTHNIATVVTAARMVLAEPDPQIRLALDKVFRKETGYSALETAEW